jgi:hypothetical protein
MTRRASKRGMLHRLDDFPVVRIHLDNLRSSSARVMVDGIACEVKFQRKARQDLLSESGIVGYVETIPYAIGNGYMPPGTKSGDYARGMSRHTTELPKIGIFDDYTERADRAFNQFRAAHPIGSIVSGKVILVNRQVAILGLGLGLQGRLDTGESLDHTPGSPVDWLPLPRLGECVDVMVRWFIPRIRQVSLSLHTFQRDDGFCNYSSGYRRQFNPEAACFRKLPWEK